MAVPVKVPIEKITAGPFDGAWIGRAEGDDGVWTFLVEGKRIFVTRTGSGNWLKGSFHLKALASLHAVDVTVTDCDCELKGQTFSALARIGGDHLEIAAGRPGESRPATLEQTGLRRIRLKRAGGQSPEGSGNLTVTIGTP